MMEDLTRASQSLVILIQSGFKAGYNFCYPIKVVSFPVTK